VRKQRKGFYGVAILESQLERFCLALDLMIEKCLCYLILSPEQDMLYGFIAGYISILAV